MTGETPDLSLEDISCAYGYHVVFSGLNITMPAGRVVTLVGPNGAGKTTLMKLIAGLHPAHSGVIRWGGDVSDSLARRFLCHWISTEFPLKPKLSVHDNLRFLMSLKTGHSPDSVVIRQALSWLNIDLLIDKRVETLSSGQRTRVFLASLMLDHRPIWLLDEPSASLDESGRLVLKSMIQRHAKKKNGLVIIATHDPQLFGGEQIVEMGHK